MKNLLFILIGATIGTITFSCAMGGKSIDFDDFPIRSKDNSVFMKCLDGDQLNACKYVCTEYKKNNKCKKGHKKIVKLNIKNSLDNNFVLISKSFFLQLIRK